MNRYRFGCVALAFFAVSHAAMAQWVLLGHPQQGQHGRLFFIEQSIDPQQHTVLVKTEQDSVGLTRQLQQMLHTQEVATSHIAQRQYRCDKRQFHVPAAQFLSEQGKVLYEYDYRLKQGVMFQLQDVDERDASEQMLFKRVCLN